MNQIEKMELFIKAMKGEIAIEYRMVGKLIVPSIWTRLEWSILARMFSLFGTGCRVSITDLLKDEFEIRIVKLMPLFSDEEADFSEKYLPRDWWIARDESGSLLLHKTRPHKQEHCFRAEKTSFDAIKYAPKFESIKWTDEDCYTIQELLDNYKGYNL